MTSHIAHLEFNTTPRIVCAPGAADNLAGILADLGAKSVLIVTDKGLVDIGLVEKVESRLKTAGIRIAKFDGVLADPPEQVFIDAADLARSENVGAVVGLGGGSSLDVAKLGALVARSGERLSNIYGVELAKGPRLPLVLIPTTAGTGSEVTPVAIATTPNGEKKGVSSRHILPDLAILDANLTLSMPPRVTAMTGIDAMVHAIEAFTSKIRKNPISDGLAKQAFRHLGANIIKAVRNGNDLDARNKMLLGSMMAGMAFANAPVAAVHALAYPIGGKFHVPHGLSNSLVLPEVLRFNAPVAAPLYAELMREIEPHGEYGSDLEATEALIRHLENLISEVGLETRLSEVGISATDIEKLAIDAMKVTRLLVNNPREVTHDDTVAIYKASL